MFSEEDGNKTLIAATLCKLLLFLYFGVVGLIDISATRAAFCDFNCFIMETIPLIGIVLHPGKAVLNRGEVLT